MEDPNVLSDSSSSGSDIPQPLDDAAFVDMGQQEIDDDDDDVEADAQIAGQVPMWNFFNINAPPVQEAQAEQPPPAEVQQPGLAQPGVAPPPAEVQQPGINPPPAQPPIQQPHIAHPPPPHHPQPANPNLLDWRFFLKVFLAIVVVGGLVVFILLFLRHKNHHELPPTKYPGCVITLSVSKDGKSDFRTISEAVEATPDNSPLRICIFIGAGEYEEWVYIALEKTNLVLVGEGTEQTTITSNATNDQTAATLLVKGHNFTAQDLTISSTAKDGIAVENRSYHSVFSRCILKGVSGTLNAMLGWGQFYHSCKFYGRSYLVSGQSSCFFQKCDFFAETDVNETTVFVGQSGDSFSPHISFIFHHCGFKARSSSQVFLASAVDDFASIVVMQSYIDAPITGYVLNTSFVETSYFAIFDNSGHAPTSVPPFVHVLSRTVAQSTFSLRTYFAEIH